MGSALGIFCKVQNGVLVPLAEWDREQVERIGEGAEVTARVRRGRSPEHARWYWASLSRLVTDTPVGEKYPTKEALHEALLLSTGRTATVWHPVEELYVYVPASTAFDKMDQTEFLEYTTDAFKLIAEAFGIDVDYVRSDAQRRTEV